MGSHSAIEMEETNSPSTSPKPRYPSHNTSRTSKIVIPILSVFTIASFAIACAALAIAVRASNSISTRSLFLNNMERVYNTSIYAVAEVASPCLEIDRITITGQSNKPGECVAVTESTQLAVNSIANNCRVYTYSESNCTGIVKLGVLAPINQNFQPYCAKDLGIVPVGNGSFNIFNSFQTLCDI